MATTPKKLFRGSSTTAYATVYTVPTDTTTIVKNILIFNRLSTELFVSVMFGNNYVLYDSPIAGKDLITLDLSTVLTAGEIIKVQASVASNIDFHISGVEVS